MWLLVLAAVLAAFVYFKVTTTYKYWAVKNVPYVKPFLIFGNLAPIIFRRRAFVNLVEDYYKSFPNERYFGFFQFWKPVLVIRDPDLIKQLAVKDFEAFPDHSIFVTGEADPLVNKTLFSIKGKDGWHDMRPTLTPSFTSSKMKTMFVLIQECSSQFVNYFKDQKGVVTLEVKDAFSRFTNDVIGSIAFGVTCNSLKDKNNEFYLMGKDATDLTATRMIKVFGYLVIPSIMTLLKIKLFGNKVISFLTNLILETVRIREEKNIVRPDMIHLMMEARKDRLKQKEPNTILDSGFAVAEESQITRPHKKKKVEITDEVIVAQALVFFIAGFDTSSNLMAYTAYELAVNPDIQDELYREIKKVVDQGNGQMTYEGLLGMKYLDKVITESLRLHPIAFFTDRISTKPYTIQPQQPGEKSVDLDKGSIIWFPIAAIHLDPNNYANPELFDPERFSDENKHKIKPFTFIPFGAGPRNCIGSRLALLESKLIIVELLRCFEFVRCEKTQVPLQLSKSHPLPVAEGGIWIGLKPR